MNNVSLLHQISITIIAIFSDKGPFMSIYFLSKRGKIAVISIGIISKYSCTIYV